MPFAGSEAAAHAALWALRQLDVRPGDELILVDNAGSPGVLRPDGRKPEVRIVPAAEEHSPAYARNVGAAEATREWILFLDADTQPAPGLLEALWAGGIADDVGAVAGEIVAAAETASLAGRYGSVRSFLGQRAHHEHPYRPRAAAANLLVRRAAFEEVGGFYEGLRAAEDTDFTWRLQDAGWRLVLRGDAVVEHRYRTSLSELRRQWRGYAAGRAWLSRRYEAFVPEPALLRAVRRAGRALRGRGSPRISRDGPSWTRAPIGRSDRGRFLVLDGLLSLEELVGFTLSNRPARSGRPDAVAVVLIADRFPARDDPLVALAESLGRARVEAVARPPVLDLMAFRRLVIDYLEDDGRLERLADTAWLVLRHPWRAVLDAVRRSADEPPLRILAPAVRRLKADRRARLHTLGGGQSRAIAERLARLTSRPLE
jgi:GT2 family glycosyltransferase